MTYEIQNLQKLNRSVIEKHKHIIVNEVNDSCVTIAVNEQDYPWHYHPTSDELFIMVEGLLTIDFQSGKSIILRSNDTLLVPAGTIHRSRPKGRAVNLVIERSDTETIFIDE
jgi:mannose-6-phosphate isomerase-like protein (cupin superfamily)